MPNHITRQGRKHPPYNKTHGKGVTQQQLALFAPIYEATPYWDLEPVAPSESLPGQRYRLALVHGNLRRAIPIQLHPDEGDRLFEAVRAIECDWALDLDKTGQLCSFEAAAALRCLLGAVMGGKGNG
jgi:hypothetical protein